MNLENKRIIAYLAPEIPARSATFVYEEIKALERAGVAVVPFSVHVPPHAEKVSPEIYCRTHYLYRSTGLAAVLLGLFALLARLANLSGALGALVHDVLQVRSTRQRLALVFQFLTGARLANRLLRARCSHLHIHFAHVPCQIGMYASLLSGIPFTVTSHANDIFERGILLKEKAERARKFLTVSQFNLDYLKRLGLPEEKLGLVRCGVSFAAPKLLPALPQRVCFRVGSLGRMVEKKGFDVLLQALKRMDEQGFCFELQLAGDGPLMPALLQQVGELNLGDKVRFLGAMGHDHVANWLASLDLFILACKQDSNGDMDGIPVVLMEAMSQGIPVVSTRISGIPELIIDDQTGLLAEPNDVDSLVRVIWRLVGDQALRKRLAGNAQRHVMDEFGQEVNLNRLQQYFD